MDTHKVIMLLKLGLKLVSNFLAHSLPSPLLFHLVTIRLESHVKKLWVPTHSDNNFHPPFLTQRQDI